jgi:hypothetical protein
MSNNRYTQLIEGIAELVHENVPEDAILLVATGGDQQLLSFGERVTIDFPDGVEDRGVTYPPPGLVAIAQLEVHRSRGAEYLLVPSPELWLLDEFPAFERHLRHRYDVLSGDEDIAVLFALRATASSGGTVWDDFQRTVDACEEARGHDPAILDWRTGLGIREQFPDLPVFAPLEESLALPYLDGTIDIVAISQSATAAEFAEARRVAGLAVVTFPALAAAQTGATRMSVDWTGSMDAPLTRPAVIVPCSGPPERLGPFLRSLRDSLQNDDAEVVLAVDGEPGGAAQWAAEDSRVQLLEISAGGSLATTCNTAASGVDADVLVFVLPVGCLLPDWLAPLVRTFRDHQNAAAVGGRLLTFEGEVVHAGGHLLDDPGRAGTMRASAPLLSCVRPVDYASPALIATRRKLFAELGGFSPDHPTTLFVDYSLRLRERGHAVFSQPESTLVLSDRHLEFGGPSPDAPPQPVRAVEAQR